MSLKDRAQPPLARQKIIADRHISDFHNSQKRASRWQGMEFPDIWLLFAWCALIAIGMVMVTSASMSEAVGHNSDPYYYSIRQALFYVVGLVCAWVAYIMPTHFYYQNSGRFLIYALILLLILYIPSVGVSVNGARRWLNFKFFKLQLCLFAMDFRVKTVSSSFPLFLLIFIKRMVIRNIFSS